MLWGQFVLWVAVILGLGLPRAVENGSGGLTDGEPEVRSHLANWRTPANDAANTAFLMAKSKGYDVSWQDFQEKLGGRRTSLLEISDTLTALGVSNTLSECNLKQLADGVRPAIVLLDNDRKRGSSFALFVADRGGDIMVINGGAATLGAVPREDFLRSWTGHRVSINAGDSADAASLFSPKQMLLFAFLIVGYFLIRGQS